MHTILIVDDEPKLLDVLSGMLEQMGYHPLTAGSGTEALGVVDRELVDVVLCDLRMPDMDGRELLGHLVRRKHPAPFIVMTAYSSVRDAVAVTKEGAFDYIDKPIELDDLSATLAKAVRLSDALRDNARLKEELEGRSRGIQPIGRSDAFLQVMKAVAEVGPTRTTVLLSGESGTGKEVIARAIHDRSQRRQGPFVAVNCAAVPEHLLESEFFGHVKGSFTGAVANRAGRFGQADKGTLFLDEIGDMPLSLQAKILRVLQERTYEPVGSSQQRTADVRIVAATNRDLGRMVVDGQFRADLYYRLNVFSIALPALRERVGDIPMFVARFLEEFGSEMGRPGLHFSDEAMAVVTGYAWPGNIRELQNFIERTVISARGDVIALDDLPPYLAQRAPSTAADKSLPVDLDEVCASFERGYILAALQRTDGVQVRAAELLGITERSLWHRLKKHEISIDKAVSARIG